MRAFLFAWLLANSLQLSAQDVSPILAHIEERNALAIGYRVDAPPFSQHDAAGNPEGYAVDICLAIADAVEARIERSLNLSFTEVPIASAIEAINRETVDLLCSATSVTEERNQQVDFSSAIYTTPLRVLVRADSTTSNLAELSGGKVAAVGSTTSAIVSERLAEQYNWQVVKAITAAAAVGQLTLGWVDGVVNDEIFLDLVLEKDTSTQYRVLPETLAEEEIAIAFRAGDPVFTALVNEALATLRTSGALEAFKEKWFE